MPVLAFGTATEIDEETLALEELRDFLEKPQSIGLTNLKHSLRNVVLLMLELKGLSTGFIRHILANEEHPSMTMDGLLEGDKKRKRLVEEFWEEMRRLERLMEKEFGMYVVKMKMELSVQSL